MTELKPCPACGSPAKLEHGWVVCIASVCMCEGPFNDYSGEKWNAMPRRDETKGPQKDTSDGTLSAMSRERWLQEALLRLITDDRQVGPHAALNVAYDFADALFGEEE